MSEGRRLIPGIEISHSMTRQTTTLSVELPDAEFSHDRERFCREMGDALRRLYDGFLQVWDEHHPGDAERLRAERAEELLQRNAVFSELIRKARDTTHKGENQ